MIWCRRSPFVLIPWWPKCWQLPLTQLNRKDAKVVMRTTKPRIQARIPIPMDLPCNAKAFVGTGSGTRIERILCAVDFSQFSARAYAYAQSIAGHYRATLVVQHIVELWQHPSVDYCVSPHGYEDFRRKFV